MMDCFPAEPWSNPTLNFWDPALGAQAEAGLWAVAGGRVLDVEVVVLLLGELPKIRSPNTDPEILGLLLEEHPQKGPPI